MRNEEKPTKQTGKGDFQAKGISQPKAQRERGLSMLKNSKKFRCLELRPWEARGDCEIEVEEWPKRYSTEHTLGPQLTGAPYKCFVWLVASILIYNQSDF